jgi:hypothetical protein
LSGTKSSNPSYTKKRNKTAPTMNNLAELQRRKAELAAHLQVLELQEETIS